KKFGLGTVGTEYDVADDGASSSCLATGNAARCSSTRKLPATSRPWTPAEKNAFFRALSVYSRWRPDLIAAAVPTRTVWEVDSYLIALEEGATLLDMAENGDESLSDLDFDEGDSGSDVELEPAYEVSDAWVAVEEALASYIVQGENSALLERYRNSFVAEKGRAKEKRPRHRPRIDGDAKAKLRCRRRGAKRFASDADAQLQGGADSEHVGGTQGDRSTVASEVQTVSSDEPPAKRFCLEKRGDYLACLGDAHLSALDAILKDDDELLRMEKNQRENQDSASLPLATREKSTPDPAREREMQTVMNVTETIAGDPSNAVIDPELLAISGVPINITTTMSSIPTRSVVATDRSLLASSGPPLTEAAVAHATRPDTADFMQSGVRAVNEDLAILNPNLLSPKSRRRLQKRLYMRRRRAKLQGKEAASYGVTEFESAGIGQSVGLGLLKAGPKTKVKRRGTTPKSSAPTSDAESDDGGPAKAKRFTRGLTLRPKLRSIFSKLDIDAAYLRAQGVDLLHLNALARLMGMGHRQPMKAPNEVEEEIPFSIDVTLIQHLQAAVVFFVTDVICRAIAWKEGQIRLKKGSLAWRSSDQSLTASAIKHAVETLSVRYRSHKEFFTEFCSRNDAESSNAENEFDATHHSNSSNGLSARSRDGEGCENEDPAVPMISTHRDIHMPFIRPPPALGLHPLDCFSRIYMREAAGRADRVADREDEEDADWMSSETDEETLEAELREDEALDEEDMESAEEYEEMLWEALGEASGSAMIDEGPCA
ncbi:hypothetical protein F5J12DRAFT_855466, partial [Pisolithus orientalis]|uniref:uncharacterized protein n=1 Tax=Pisolithus orientalis TaxID=936130 RepID=UPI0022248D89